jgi:cellobiose-specific phosphotransferase system component IIC
MVRFFLRQLVSFIFLWLPLLILFWAVRLWARSTPRIATPAWRSYVALAATTLVSVSVLLWVTSLLWARGIGGFPFYDPLAAAVLSLGTSDERGRVVHKHTG